MTTRTITAIYDSEVDARHAREQLLDAGLDDDEVRVVSHNLTSTPVGSVDHDKGVWESIKEFFVGDDDRSKYSEGMRRGGYLLTALVDEEHSAEAISTLEKTNAIDLDERAEQWRSEGWTDSDTFISGERTTTTVTQASAGSNSQAGSGAQAGSASQAGSTFQASQAGARESDAGDERRIPVVEERLRVGKREVDRGGVRVRSYVIEEPVHEKVSLHEEHVDVQRRPVGERAATSSDELFRDQTIEVTEHGEEPVIAKEAVVKEEVIIRKTGEDRVEEIDDTVRHTEVDVDDKRAGKNQTQNPNPSGTSGNSGARKRR